MLAHEFLGEGDGMMSDIREIMSDGDTIHAAAYVHYPREAAQVEEATQFGAIVFTEKGVMQALVSQASMHYSEEIDSCTVQVSGEAVQEVQRKLPFPGTYYQITVGENQDDVREGEYIVWKPDEPVTHPLGFMAITK